MSVKPFQGGFRVYVRGGGNIQAQGFCSQAAARPKAWSLPGLLGHTIIDPVPALFGLRIKAPELDSMQGTALKDVALSLDGTRLSASGPAIITHTGLSGPAALRLSSLAARVLAQDGCGRGSRSTGSGRKPAPGKPKKLARGAAGARKHVMTANPFINAVLAKARIPRRRPEKTCAGANSGRDVGSHAKKLCSRFGEDKRKKTRTGRNS